MDNENLIGREIYITNRASKYYKEIGTITEINKGYTKIHYKDKEYMKYSFPYSKIGIIIPKAGEEILLKSGEIDLSILEECLLIKDHYKHWIKSASNRRKAFKKEKPRKIRAITYTHIKDYIVFSIEKYYCFIPIEEIDQILIPSQAIGVQDATKKKEEMTRTIEIPRFPMKYFIV